MTDEQRGFTLSPSQKNIVDEIINGENYYNYIIMGEAGTGKSVVIREIASLVRTVLVAPSGIASVNIGGNTIHSQFGIHIGGYLLHDFHFIKQLELIRARCIIIDEDGMLRPDLLDLIDKRLKEVTGLDEPFGGKQVVMFGDLLQIPPVVMSQKSGKDDNFWKEYKGIYFFDSKVYKKANFQIRELKEIYRQKDPVFAELLRRVRWAKVTNQDLQELNKRSLGSNLIEEDLNDVIQISTTNSIADNMNMEKINKLKTPKHIFTAKKDPLWDGLTPVDIEIPTRVGMRVLTTINKDGYYNGSLGIITSIEPGDYIRVLLDTGVEVIIRPNVFKKTITVDKKTEKEIEFEQLPIRMGWAISIHKSQGQTYRKVLIDLGRGCFTPGQAYVALSRAESKEGMYLIRDIKESDIFVDKRILDFLENNG